jgi:hypothetical protein
MTLQQRCCFMPLQANLAPRTRKHVLYVALHLSAQHAGVLLPSSNEKLLLGVPRRQSLFCMRERDNYVHYLHDWLLAMLARYGVRLVDLCLQISVKHHSR